MPNKANQLKLSELTILILKDKNRIFDKNKEFEIEIDTNSDAINKSRPSLYYHSLRVEAFGMCFDCILYSINCTLWLYNFNKPTNYGWNNRSL